MFRILVFVYLVVFSTISYGGDSVIVAPNECAWLPANSHATIHSRIATRDGYFVCQACHQIGGEAVTTLGIAVLCSDCHYPHERGSPKAVKQDVHSGCLDCHDELGSGELKYPKEWEYDYKSDT